MTLQFQEADDNILKIVFSDKLSKADYTIFTKAVEDRIQRYGRYGKLRLLVDLRDFHGWDTETIWEDVKFDTTHSHHVERIVVIGDKPLHEKTTILFRPFTAAWLRYFIPEQDTQARAWIKE